MSCEISATNVFSLTFLDTRIRLDAIPRVGANALSGSVNTASIKSPSLTIAAFPLSSIKNELETRKINLPSFLIFSLHFKSKVVAKSNELFVPLMLCILMPNGGKERTKSNFSFVCESSINVLPSLKFWLLSLNRVFIVSNSVWFMQVPFKLSLWIYSKGDDIVNQGSSIELLLSVFINSSMNLKT